MYKNATKCNKTIGKWCKNKHGASKIIDTFQTYHQATGSGAGKASIAEPEEVMMIEETWMQPYLAYMINKTLPEDTVEAKKIIR
jgi:hypothetical protein